MALKVLDTEVYRRYCLIGFIDPATGKIVSIEAVDKPFSLDDREWLRKYMRRHSTVGFNSAPFDLPIIYAAIAGKTPKQIKEIADAIIIDGLRPWEIEDEYKIKIPRNLDHVDLIEVAPGKASLKIYNGRMHGKRMQDLPIDPDADLTDEEIEIVYDYWKNDLAATIGLHDGLKTQLDLRREMTKEYGIDLRSKSDAQIAEAVIKTGIKRLSGRDPKRPELKGGQRYRYRIPKFIKFNDDGLLDLLDDIEDIWFKLSPSGKVLMPKALSDRKIKIGKGVYRMGIGGLHSSEENASHVADDEYMLVDRDVASYYPRIIINLGLFPPHLGKAFLKIYKGIVDRRLKAKAEAGRLGDEIKDLEKSIKESNSRSELREERLAELKVEQHKWQTIADGLKITINGSFGKLGSRWSILFAPDLLIQTTITGQLALLMLIHRFERRGFEVISANTDGIIIKIKRSRQGEYEEIIKKWEKDTGFETEETQYKAVYSRDVNNYVAVKMDGKTKRKGAYAKAGLEEKKNPTMEIVSEAVCAYMVDGTPISKTIKECKDIRKFVTVRTVRGGAIKDGKYLGKAIRWYQSTSTDTPIRYKIANESGNHNKVPKSDGGMPIMTLPDEFPSDVDFSWYIREARSILKELAFEEDIIGKPVRKSRKKKVETDA